MDSLFSLSKALSPLLGTLLGVSLLLYLSNRLLIARFPKLDGERKIPRQLTMLALTIVGVVVIVLALPVSENMQKQVLALIGVLLSGLLAFSSTTLIASLMAGLMLHVTKPFRTGDFVRVGEYFGRVSQQGLFDTEIQTEQRELVHLSNTFMVAHPVTVIRSSGTIVTASLSLGYDIHHLRVEERLLVAAQETGLEDSFVQILALGNDSITYRVSGLLIEVKSLLSARSNLYRNILDSLHGDGIEIVSPTFMNQRRLPDDAPILPPSLQPGANTDTTLADEPIPEELVFDKAEQAEQHENAKQALKDEITRLETEAEGVKGDDKKRFAGLIDQKRQQLDELESHSGATEEIDEITEIHDSAQPDHSATTAKTPTPALQNR